MIKKKWYCHRRGTPLWRAAALISLSACCVSAAGAPRTSPPKGAFCGQVVETGSGKPVAGATVALRDKHTRVLTWTKTDAQGRYTLDADSLALLDLPTAQRGGLLAAVGRGFVEVIKLPVTAAGAVVSTATDAVKAVDPIGTMKAAAIGAAGGSPVPLAAKAAGDLQSLIGGGARQTARANAAEAIINGSHAPHAEKSKDIPGPGEVGLLVSAPQYKEFRGPVGAYWMTALESGEKAAQGGPQTWLDTVRLAQAAGDKNSDVQDQAPRLSDAALDAALAAAGSPVKITVRFPLPVDPVMKVRVFAREQKTRHVIELMPQGGGTYVGALMLDPKTPLGDTTLTIVALKTTPIGVTLRDDKADPQLAWAAQREDLDADKPYHFDPRIMASENRVDLKMTVLDPKQEAKPAPAPTPAPAGH